MIVYEKDGVTLTTIAADGTRVSRSVNDGSAYSDMRDILTQQNEAVRQSGVDALLYTQLIGRMQTSADARLPFGAIPTKPQQKVVSDTGAVTFVPFVPPLPDLVIPKPNTPAPPVVVVPVADKIANQQAIMFNMILAMFQKMFPGT